MATSILSTPCYQLYQDFVDRIFGNSVVKIKPDVDNNFIGTLKYTTDFAARYKRLNMLKLCSFSSSMESTQSSFYRLNQN